MSYLSVNTVSHLSMFDSKILFERYKRIVVSLLESNLKFYVVERFNLNVIKKNGKRYVLNFSVNHLEPNNENDAVSLEFSKSES